MIFDGFRLPGRSVWKSAYEQVKEVEGAEPGPVAPVSHRAAWHLRFAQAWTDLADTEPSKGLRANFQWLADYHQRTGEALRDDLPERIRHELNELMRQQEAEQRPTG